MTDRTVPTEPTLLPCPFCGAPAALTDTMPGGAYWCHCTICECEGPASSKDAATAIGAWNRRAASPAAPGAEVEPVAFNVNDYVLVKLNEIGRDILRELDAERNRRYPDFDWGSSLPEEDEEGWSKWQLWELMKKFGPHITLGRRTPFETAIRIPLTSPPTTDAIKAQARREAYADAADAAREYILQFGNYGCELQAQGVADAISDALQLALAGKPGEAE